MIYNLLNPHFPAQTLASAPPAHHLHPAFATTFGYASPLHTSAASSLAGPTYLLARDALPASPSPPPCLTHPGATVAARSPGQGGTQVLADDGSGRGGPRFSFREPISGGTSSQPWLHAAATTVVTAQVVAGSLMPSSALCEKLILRPPTSSSPSTSTTIRSATLSTTGRAMQSSF
ncbi:hypothetical protein SEVIR_1G150980v4 [Setaria viridis]